jgi:hypothetical protein
MKRATGKSNLDIVQDYLDGVRPFTALGYVGDQNKHRNEGEVWEDREGIKWQKVKGRILRLSKTQGDFIREAIGVDTCKCGLEIKWGNRLDRKMFAKTGMCFECLIDYETKLRIVGIYNLYQNTKMLSNELAFCHDIQDNVKDTIHYFENEDSTLEILCNMEGESQKFEGTNAEAILAGAKNDLQLLKTREKELKKALKSTKSEFKRECKRFKLKAHV